MQIRSPVITLLSILLVLTLVGTTAGQNDNDPAWTLWIVQGAETFISLTLDGTATTYTFPPPEGYHWEGIDFSPDGRLMAGCLSNLGEASADGDIIIRLLEVASGETVWEMPFRRVGACNLSHAAFSADGRQITFSILQNLDDPDVPPAWELWVLDVAAGEPSHVLTPDSPAMAAQRQGYLGYLPRVRRFEDDAITFALQGWLGVTFNDLVAYRWHLEEDVLEPAPPGYATLLVDHGPTGEVAWYAHDESFPVIDDYANNLVMYTGADGSAYPIYHSAEMSTNYARFIDDGRAVAVWMNDPADFYTSHWFTIWRDGTVEPIVWPSDSTPQYQFYGAPAGYVFTDYTKTVEDNITRVVSTAVIYRRMAGGSLAEETVLWEGDKAWFFAWAAPMPFAEDLPPFAEIAQP